MTCAKVISLHVENGGAAKCLWDSAQDTCRISWHMWKTLSHKCDRSIQAICINMSVMSLASSDDPSCKYPIAHMWASQFREVGIFQHVNKGSAPLAFYFSLFAHLSWALVPRPLYCYSRFRLRLNDSSSPSMVVLAPPRSSELQKNEDVF